MVPASVRDVHLLAVGVGKSAHRAIPPQNHVASDARAVVAPSRTPAPMCPLIRDGCQAGRAPPGLLALGLADDLGPTRARVAQHHLIQEELGLHARPPFQLLDEELQELHAPASLSRRPHRGPVGPVPERRHAERAPIRAAASAASHPACPAPTTMMSKSSSRTGLNGGPARKRGRERTRLHSTSARLRRTTAAAVRCRSFVG